MPIVFFIILGAVVIAALIYGLHAAEKRRKELAAWAQSKGLSFDPQKHRGFDERFPNFKCLKRGHSRYAYNIMSGILGSGEFLGFDYHYTTGSGKNRQDHHFSAVILQSPIMLKPLFIRSENVFDKLTEFAGFDDIDFESAEFSRKFYVKSPDKRWAYDVIHPRMMEYLLTRPVFTIQFDLNRIIAHRNKKFSINDFTQAIEHVEGVIERFPEYLAKQQRQNSVT